MKRSLYITAAVGALVITGLSFAYAQSGSHMGQMRHGAGGGGGGGGMHMHDEGTMPGLRGENASIEESDEIALMLRSFDTITREVENLPNGIRSVTRSSDPEVMDALVSHTVGMIDRVGEKDDPKIFVQSPTLDIFFMRGDEILSDIEVTEDGIVVLQTSDNPDIVAALHTHAAEVSQMAERGMDAIHDMMMQSGRGH